VSSILEPFSISSSSSTSTSECNSSARELAHELCASTSSADAAKRRQGARAGSASPRAREYREHILQRTHSIASPRARRGQDTHPPPPLSATSRARADGRWQSYALSQLQWQNVCDAEARNVQVFAIESVLYRLCSLYYLYTLRVRCWGP